VHFRVLGDIAVVGARGRQGAGGPRQRRLLALFLARPNEVLSAARLADELWDGHPPSTDAALRVQLARLRQLLREQGLDDVLVTRGSGYALDVDPDDIDAGRFQREAHDGAELRAAGRHRDAVTVLNEALGLWEGRAYADAGDLDVVRPEVERLEAARLQAEDERAAALLQAGDHGRAATELARLVREQPLRERFTGLLMVALERGGRQTEALRAYTALRTTLADELGLDPSAMLQRLEHAVLSQQTGPAVAELLGEPAGVAVRPAPPSLPATLDNDSQVAFLGRRHELETLTSLVDGLRAGQGARLVLVRGEPGMGKTRLLTAIAREAVAREVDVVHGWSDPDPVIPFQPLVEALRPLAADPRYAELVELAAQPGDSAGAETQRYRLFESVADTLAERVRVKPLLVVIDDAHWADRPTVALLRFLLRRTAGLPLLVVAAARNTEMGAEHPLDELLHELTAQHRGSVVDLGPLATGEAKGLAEAAVGSLQGELASTVADAAGGNPLFVIELARHLDAVGRTGTLPDSVRSLLRQRVGRLAEPTRRLLVAGAVAGPTFAVPLVQSMTGLDDGALVDALEEGVLARLVTESAVEQEAFTFTHDLVRQGLLAELSAPRRRRLHGVAASWLAVRHPHRLGELAHHQCEAVPLVPAAEAATTALQAAEQAKAAGAPEQAGALAHRAADVLSSAAETNPVLLATAHVMEGEAQVLSGEAAASRKAYAEAVRIIRTHDIDEFELLARAITGQYAFGFELGGDPELRSLLDRTIARMRTRDSRLLSRALSAAAYELTYAGDIAGSYACVAEALAVAERIDDPIALASALHHQHHLLLTDPDLPQRMALARRNEAVAHDSGDRLGEHLAVGDVMADHLAAGNLNAYEATLPHFADLVEETRWPMGRWVARAMAATVAIGRGRGDEAEALISEAATLGGQLEVGIAFVSYGAQLFGLRHMQGRLAELRPLVEGFVGSSTAEAVWGQAIALCRWHDGDRDGARALFDSLLDLPRAEGPRSFLWPVQLVLTAETVHLLGTASQASAVRDLLLPYAGQQAVLGSGVSLAGPVDRGLALLDWTRGRPDDAVAGLEACAANLDRQGFAGWAARTRADLANLTRS
jgi:DNA-binding SARP family transcriptional activator